MPYTKTGSFGSGNIFFVQLSDSAGIFTGTAPVIGSKFDSGKASDIIRCAIPVPTPEGRRYRLQIFSSNPPGVRSASNTYDIRINRPVSSFAESNSPICEGDTLRLYDTVAFVNDASYLWTGPMTITAHDTVIPHAGTWLSGNYQLTVTKGKCVTTGSVNVLVDTMPLKPVIVPNKSVLCAGELLSFTVSQTSTTNYSWTGPNGFNPTISNPSIANTTTANSGRYIVTVTRPITGCFERDTQDITVNPSPKQPVASIADTPVCSGRNLSLIADSATPGATYSWTGPLSSSQQNPVFTNVTVAHSGQYQITVALGTCTSADSLDVVVNPTPVIQNTSFENGCTGDTLRLIANSPTAGTYNWFDSTGFSSSSIDNVATRPNAVVAFSGRYHVAITSGEGCVSDTASVDVVVAESPAEPSISNNSPVCAGKSLILDATSSTQGVTYSWTGPGGFNVTGKNVYLQAADTVMSGQYTITVINGECSATANTDVIVNPFHTPAVTISADPGIEISKMTRITFRANAENAGSSPAYQWRRNGMDIPGATNEMYRAVAGVDVSDNDSIAVMVTSNAECPLPDSIVSYTFKIDISTDVETGNVINDLKIYPNPSSGSFRVKGAINTDEPVEVRVINITGDIIYNDIATPAGKTLDHSINLGEVSAGIYLLQLNAGEQVINLRFMVKN